MEIQINSWLKASQDTGNPNVDGESNDIICSANTGNARSDSFEIMAGVLENGEPVDELRVGVTVNQAKYVQKIIGGHVNVFFGDYNESDLNYINGIVSVQVYINDVDVTGHYSYDTNGAGYTLNVIENMQDIIDYSNNSADIRFLITVDTNALRDAGYHQIRVLTLQPEDIVLLVNTERYDFDIPETTVTIYSPAEDKEINVTDTYTGLDIQAATTFALDANINCYLS